MPVSQRRSQMSETIPANVALSAFPQTQQQGFKPSEPNWTLTEMHQDAELQAFVRGITSLAKKEGIAPTLLLSCVVSESHFTNSRTLTHLAQDAEFMARKERMTRALFQLIWREEFEAVFGETMTAEDRHRSPSGDTQPVPVPFQVGDGVASQLRLIAQRQLKEKIQAEKKAERVAKIERWRGKKQRQKSTTTIKYPARQQLAKIRKRRKGQFVSNDTPTVS